MHDAGIVGRRQSAGDFDAQVEHLAQAHGAVVQAITQALAVQQLGDDVWCTVVLTDAENRNNVGMTEGSRGLGFHLKTAQPLRVARPEFGQYFDRDVTLQRSIASPIDLAHSARAQGRNYLIGIDPRPDDQWHMFGGLYLESRPTSV